MELKTEPAQSSPPSPSKSPREQLMEMIQGYWVSQICGTAARLRLADQLEHGPRTIAELASLTSADPDGLGRLLRAGATVGLFTGVLHSSNPGSGTRGMSCKRQYLWEFLTV